MRSLSRFVPVLLVLAAALAGCASASPGPATGGPVGGDSGRDSGAGTGDGARGPDGADGRVEPATCPATAPTGACTDSSLECRYVDAQGCPQTFDCFEYLGTSSWTTRISEPGGSCSTAGQICTYEEAIGDNLPSYGALRCGESGKWEQHSLCPTGIPMDGEPCAYPFLSCSYQGCGGTRLAYCNGPTDGWQVEPCPDAGP